MTEENQAATPSWKATTSCRHCGYEPVAYSAVFCPQCGGQEPARLPRRFWHYPAGVAVFGVMFFILWLLG